MSRAAILNPEGGVAGRQGALALVHAELVVRRCKKRVHCGISARYLSRRGSLSAIRSRGIALRRYPAAVRCIATVLVAVPIYGSVKIAGTAEVALLNLPGVVWIGLQIGVSRSVCAAVRIGVQAVQSGKLSQRALTDRLPGKHVLARLVILTRLFRRRLIRRGLRSVCGFLSGLALFIAANDARTSTEGGRAKNRGCCSDSHQTSLNHPVSTLRYPARSNNCAIRSAFPSPRAEN